ncbi:DUF599 domain-containing protein [Aureimonas sp. AU20]|uniref:DUF599 domain-containing protein n=1 Tax=Aureimonas sp. AU20 TaxID=1349819 RepID=UPI000721C562|nr:DUF599 family protein [Aureimonas sp. AU20]ALN73251.1 hypothetical protein M673_11030 [Aureimonas sp. AU20]
MPLQQILDPANLVALLTFSLGWTIYAYAVDGSALSRRGLSRRMNMQREAWMYTMLRRDLRMIDTAIMTGLQQGTGFFASACIFAIGGCFALMGSADHIATVVTDLPLQGTFDRALLESKLLGLVTIFVFAFFKFGWAYRLFNYCTILIGAVPMAREAEADPEAAELAVRRALRMNQIAARHFNSGLRAIFFAMAYLGWFISPWVLIATTLTVILILARRQFYSDANDCLATTREDDAS